MAAVRHASARQARLEQHMAVQRQLEAIAVRLARCFEEDQGAGEAQAIEIEGLEHAQVKLRTLSAQLDAHIARLYVAEQDPWPRRKNVS